MQSKHTGIFFIKQPNETPYLEFQNALLYKF